MSQLRVWVRYCAKCGKRFTTTSEATTIPNWYLCEKCGRLWEAFYENNSERIEGKYPKRFNPTYEAFIGTLKEKERVEFT